jgi:uncharacterized membrane protein
MIQALKQPVVRFLVIGALLYFLWLLLYYFFIKVHTEWDYYLDYTIVYLSQQLLHLFGYVTMVEIESDHVILMLDHTTNTGVWVGDECNGFKAFLYFLNFRNCFSWQLENEGLVYSAWLTLDPHSKYYSCLLTSVDLRKISVVT